MSKIEWTTPEYIHTEKHTDWYWVVGIITITIALIAIILSNLIFAILILVSGFTLSLFASRHPEHIKIIIDDLGIRVGKTYYPYKRIEGYYVESKDNYPRILLRLDSYLSPLIKILIDENMAEEIDEKLSNHIQKEELTEPIFEKFLIYFGF